MIHRSTGYISRNILQHSILLMEFGSELQIMSNNCQVETFEFATVQRCEPLLDLEQTPELRFSWKIDFDPARNEPFRIAHLQISGCE